MYLSDHQNVFYFWSLHFHHFCILTQWVFVFGHFWPSKGKDVSNHIYKMSMTIFPELKVTSVCFFFFNLKTNLLS